MVKHKQLKNERLAVQPSEACLFFITLAKVSYWQNPKSKAKGSVHSTVIIQKDMGLPGGLVVKNPPDSSGDARDSGSIPGSGRFPGEGNDNPLQYSCLENHMDGTWQGIPPWGCKELDMTERLIHTMYVSMLLSPYFPPSPSPPPHRPQPCP